MLAEKIMQNKKRHPTTRRSNKREKIADLFQKYLNALRRHLRTGKISQKNVGVRLGKQAFVNGIETLTLARMHEKALRILKITDAKITLNRQSGNFFSEVNFPLEKSYGLTLKKQARIKQLEETVEQRTSELWANKKKLKKSALQCKIMKNEVSKNWKHHNKCLVESLKLQKRLRQLTHRVLAAQEDERHKISHELQDEIAQTLLGINVRLLSLKQEAGTSSKGLKNEIANTQRLVVKSVKSVRRFAHELNPNHSTTPTRPTQ
jgi:signal transduction histidine kinase